MCKNLLCVCYRLTSKAQRRQCQSQPRAQRRQHLDLDAKCAPQMNTFIISCHRLHSSFLWGKEIDVDAVNWCATYEITAAFQWRPSRMQRSHHLQASCKVASLAFVKFKSSEDTLAYFQQTSLSSPHFSTWTRDKPTRAYMVYRRTQINYTGALYKLYCINYTA